MKIGILTQPLHNNYGGLLQNFALHAALKQLGHEPVTIDIPYSEPKWPLHTRIIKLLWRLIKKLRGDRSVLFCDLKQQWQFMNHPGKEQTRFIDTYINILRVREGLKNGFCQEHDFDAYVVGSDQIWRPRFSPCLPNFFLDFTDGVDVKRIAYAASFGTDKWEGTVEQTPRIAQLAQRFDAISVREKTGITLCKNIFNAEAQWVLDPTLLPSKKVYDKLVATTKRPSDKPYLVIYALDINSTIDALIKQICKERNLVPIYIGQPSGDGYPSIDSWLKGIFCSDYVLTDSFHGTVFSIIAHRPFTTVVNSGRGASRFESLLGSLNLMDRMTESTNVTNINTPINYEEIDARLVGYRQLSFDFLKRALDGKYK